MVLLVCGIGLGSAAALTLSAFSDNLVFFVSPSDLAKSTSKRAADAPWRTGGAGHRREVRFGGQAGAQFKVTDGNASVTVVV